MPHIIAIENSEAQRRQLADKINELEKNGWALNGKYEASTFGTWEKLFETAIAPGLFVQREVIVIEDAESFGKFPEGLAGLIEDDKADCVIILVFGSDAKNMKPVEKAVETIKSEAQVPPWKRKDWVLSLAKEHKFRIAPDAAQLLGENIDSQEELRNEVMKLAVFAAGREVTLKDVEDLSFAEGGRAQLIFLDGVCDNRPADVAKCLKYLRSSPLLITLTALTNRLRPALMLSCFQGKYADEAISAIGVNKNYAINKARNALKNFGAERIKRFMLSAVRLSYLEKTNRAEGWQGFEIILWEFMSKI